MRLPPGPPDGATIERFRRRFTELGLATGEGDRAEAEAGVAAVYGTLGLVPPAIHWCSSPLAAIRGLVAQCGPLQAVHAVPVGELVQSALRRCRDRLFPGTTHVLEHMLWRPVERAVWGRVGRHVQESLVAIAQGPTRAGEGWRSWPVSPGTIHESTRGSWPAQHAAGALALLAMMREELRCEGTVADTAGLEAIAAAAGWLLAYRHHCFLSERPVELRLDEQGRLHQARGPAIVYADGFSLHALHGVIVAADRVHPERITVDAIDKEANAEVRRSMLELYGHERYLRDGGMTLVSRDACGELYRRAYRDDEPLVLVRVVNSTPEPDGSHRRYVLRVPPSMRTAREAVAWTFGFEPRDYRPVHET